MKIKLLLPVMVMLLVLTACRQTDVIGNDSIRAFKAITEASEVIMDVEHDGWSLSAPDDTARFIWSKDWSKNDVYDVMFEFDIQPFVDAGLDVSKMPQGMSNDTGVSQLMSNDTGVSQLIVIGDMIMFGTDLGNNTLTYNGDATPIASYEHIVRLKRDNIGYHMALDHYGINLGDGNMFEWAKDMVKNDNDIVFVLNPQPFIDAGTDPEQIDGWLFATVETMDDKGNKVFLDKLLKPFDLN